jgi:hypothetical protein
MLTYIAAHWIQFSLAAGVVLILLAKWAWQGGWFSGWKWPTIGGGTATPPKSDDAADFAALSQLRKRFETQKCRAAVAKCDELLTLFFHHDEGTHAA